MDYPTDYPTDYLKDHPVDYGDHPKNYRISRSQAPVAIIALPLDAIASRSHLLNFGGTIIRIASAVQISILSPGRTETHLAGFRTTTNS